MYLWRFDIIDWYMNPAIYTGNFSLGLIWSECIDLRALSRRIHSFQLAASKL